MAWCTVSYSKFKKIHSPKQFEEKCVSEVVSIGIIII